MKNYLKKILFFSFVCLSFFLADKLVVNASIVSSKFMGKVDNSIVKEHYSPGEVYTYNGDYILTNNDSDVFFGFTYCATGNYKFAFPVDIDGSTAPIGIYSSGVSCNLDQSGYYGVSYTFYFLALKWHDAGNGNYSIRFNTRVTNPESYNSLITGYRVFVAEYIPASVQYSKDYDDSFNSLNSSLNQVAQRQDTLSTQQQQILTQQQQIISEQQNTTDAINDVNNTLTNDDATGAINEADSFFSGFESDTFGLTSIITAPINLIASITSSSCSPLPLKVPFLSENNTLNLPCFKSIYEEHFGSFLTIYQTITFGIVAYWVCVKIFNLVKDFKNPEHDEIEVLDL